MLFIMFLNQGMFLKMIHEMPLPRFDSDLGMNWFIKFRLLFEKSIRIKVMETQNTYKVKYYNGVYYIVEEETHWLYEYAGSA